MVQELGLVGSPTERFRVLCLGAHADDIEIGCAGTLIQLLAARPGTEVRWLVFSAPEDREREAHASARRLAGDAASLTVEVLHLRDGHFPTQRAEAKERLESLREDFAPDLIFTHRGADRHQDHRLVSELTWQTFRDHLVLEYEIPKYEGDLGRPNLFVPLPEEIARSKARHLMEAFPSQRDKAWFDEETFLGLSRLRGVECGSQSRYAEGFYSRKAVVTWGS